MTGTAAPATAMSGVIAPVPGAGGRDRRAAALDAWLAGLLTTATAGAAGSVGSVGSVAGVALVALGGLARRECGPYSDVDLMLVHAGPAGPAGPAGNAGPAGPAGNAGNAGCGDVGAIAARIWYPVWDAGLALDHSVRTVEEALDVAARDAKAALALLDARHLAGDDALTARLREATLTQWRRRAQDHLPALREITVQRWRQHGELAFLLDGDVKEARGGLRDVRVLRAVAYAQVADAWRPPVRAAYARLLDVRDCLHVVAGRRRDRLLGQDLDDVASLLAEARLAVTAGAGLPMPAAADALRRRVADDARTIAYAVDDSLRAAQRWLTAQQRAGRRDRSGRTLVEPDVVAQDGEVVLARAAVSPSVDPTLSVRVAAAAAGHGLPISPATLEWLAGRCPPLPRPWPDQARAAFARLLGSGAALVPTWEACDRFGLVTAWLPEWARVRSAPQHHPVHRFTLDRHLVEAAAAAARHARDVSRPDLLSLGALLHDIGKGLPGDHSIVGVDVAAGIAAAIGLPAPDVDVIGRLVRWHLLLPEVATRRDLDDPQTIRHVADRIGDVETLSLLHALSRADAAATGPAAWSAWKERLVADLVDRVRARLLRGSVSPASTVPAWPPSLVTPPAVEVTADRVVVAAADRRGLLARVAACLTVHRLDVVSADIRTVDIRTVDAGAVDIRTIDAGAVAMSAGHVTVVTCRIQPRGVATVDRPRLAADLTRTVAGTLNVDDVPNVRERGSERSRGDAGNAQNPPATARHRGATENGAPPPRVVWAVDDATDATILELRAADETGLLHRVAHALDIAGVDVRAARISTLGPDVVDTFYLTGDWSDAASRSTVESVVLAAAARTGETVTT